MFRYYILLTYTCIFIDCELFFKWFMSDSQRYPEKICLIRNPSSSIKMVIYQLLFLHEPRSAALKRKSRSIWPNTPFKLKLEKST